MFDQVLEPSSRSVELFAAVMGECVAVPRRHPLAPERRLPNGDSVGTLDVVGVFGCSWIEWDSVRTAWPCKPSAGCKRREILLFCVVQRRLDRDTADEVRVDSH